jgi:LysM repeat protein
MKKSDIAIYVSAVLTLILTTFVVFSTQKVTYESKIDDLLNNGSESTLATNEAAPAGEERSALFQTQAPEAEVESIPNTVAAGDKTSLDPMSPEEVVIPAASIPSVAVAPSAALPEPTVSIKEPVRSEPKSAAIPDYTIPGKTASESFETAAPVAVRESAPAPAARQVREENVRVSGSGTYVVQSGDMLRTIAARHGISTSSLIRMNRDRVSNPNLIYPGMRLVVR